MRLTEVEVHGTDLGLNLPDWSEIFIDTVLPMRLEWLNVRRTNHREFGRELTGAWLLAASDGPTYKVSVDGTKVESRPALRNARTTAVIEASSRDLLALLLGRPLVTPPVITGDVTFGQSFARVFLVLSKLPFARGTAGELKRYPATGNYVLRSYVARSTMLRCEHAPMRWTMEPRLGAGRTTRPS